MNAEVTNMINGIKLALAQHAQCSIARDAAGRYPNTNRVARGASNAIESILQLDAIGNAQTNMLPAITQQLTPPADPPAAPVLDASTSQLLALVKDIDARLKKANL